MAKKKAGTKKARERHLNAVTAFVLLVQGVPSGFKKGDEVTDLTAKQNRWPDVNGVVRKTDGPLVLVRYTSGNERWKIATNIKKTLPRKRK